MYLSRLILNGRSRQVQRELGYPYQMHRTILGAFPEGLLRDERILFRLESNSRTQMLSLLVQSIYMPDWTGLTKPGKRYLLSDGQLPAGWENPAVKPFELHLQTRQKLIFRLHANPTKRLGKGAGIDHGKRVGIYEEEKQIEWLKRKAEVGGFRLLQVSICNDGKLKDTIHRSNAQDEKLELCAVQFEGMLEVLDVEKLVESVANGIGSGKGFGFGLLSLAPVR